MKKRKFRVTPGVKQLPGVWAQVDPLWGYNLRRYIFFWRKKRRVPKLDHGGVFLNHDCYHLIYYDMYKPGMDLKTKQSPGFIIAQKYLYEERG